MLYILVAHLPVSMHLCLSALLKAMAPCHVCILLLEAHACDRVLRRYQLSPCLFIKLMLITRCVTEPKTSDACT